MDAHHQNLGLGFHQRVHFEHRPGNFTPILVENAVCRLLCAVIARLDQHRLAFRKRFVAHGLAFKGNRRFLNFKFFCHPCNLNQRAIRQDRKNGRIDPIQFAQGQLCSIERVLNRRARRKL